jgi:hypothetical protein
MNHNVHTFEWLVSDVNMHDTCCRCYFRNRSFSFRLCLMTSSRSGQCVLVWAAVVGRCGNLKDKIIYLAKISRPELAELRLASWVGVDMYLVPWLSRHGTWHRPHAMCTRPRSGMANLHNLGSPDFSLSVPPQSTYQKSSWQLHFNPPFPVPILSPLKSLCFRFFIISFEGFLGSFRLYLVYFGFYCLLFSERWLRTSEDRGERQVQISGILLRGMLRCHRSPLWLPRRHRPRSSG